MTRERQGGFSLIELLVAMTITLIVSGAIYGLLAGGQNAFRREPELTERQQNIRLAMDMITRDVAAAGVGLPPFAQVFTTGLDAEGPMGPSGSETDALEMLTGGGRESEPVCAPSPMPTVPELFLTRQQVGPLDPTPTDGDPRMVFLIYSTEPDTTSDDRWTVRRVTDQGPPEGYTPGGAPPDCSDGTNHPKVTFEAGNGNPADFCGPALIPPFGNVIDCAGQRITRIVFANQVRYQIRNDPSDGVPVLQRSSTENLGTFETLARGIEELQVQYTTVAAPATWVDDAPAVEDPMEPRAPGELRDPDQPGPRDAHLAQRGAAPRRRQHRGQRARPARAREPHLHQRAAGDAHAPRAEPAAQPDAVAGHLVLGVGPCETGTSPSSSPRSRCSCARTDRCTERSPGSPWCWRSWRCCC